jgi:hypothetical protein
MYDGLELRAVCPGGRSPLHLSEQLVPGFACWACALWFFGGVSDTPGANHSLLAVLLRSRV